MDEGGYGGRGDVDQGGEGRGGRTAARGIGRGQGRGRAGGRGAGRGRHGYFTDGRGGQALDFEDDAFSRGGRSSSGRGRGRGRGPGRQGFEGGERRQRDDFVGGGGRRGARTDDTAGRGGVWGYEDDDDDDVVGVRPTAASTAGAVRVESSSGADDEVDDGSLGSRMGPVDREHFYSIKVLLSCSGLPCFHVHMKTSRSDPVQPGPENSVLHWVVVVFSVSLGVVEHVQYV